MRLIDYFKADLDGLTTKERRAARVQWHAAARRYLQLLSITSDSVAPFPQPNENGWFPDHIKPRARFFLSRPVDQLVELYRVTKPKTPQKPKETDV